LEESATQQGLPHGPLRKDPERFSDICRSLRPTEYPEDIKALARSAGFKVSAGRVPQGRGLLTVDGKKRLIVLPRLALKEERLFTTAYLLGLHLLDAAPHVIRPWEVEKEDSAAWGFAAELLMPGKLLDDELLLRAQSIGQAAKKLGVPPVEMERRARQLYAAEFLPWHEVRNQPEQIGATLTRLLGENVMPVPVHLLALLLEVRVRVMPAQPESGILEVAGSTATISLAARDERTRQRFTLAMLLQVLLRARPGRYTRTKAFGLEPRQPENYSALAGDLLVQPQLLKSVVAREYPTPDSTVPHHAVEALAERFQVSRLAMEVVLQRGGFIPQKRAVQTLEGDFEAAG
jgi:Zn-dependent peptidase ImmA (M78 family)